MLYCVFVAPFVNAMLLVLALYVLQPTTGVSTMTTALMLWVCGAGHGIMIDWATMRMPLSAALVLELSTFMQALVNGLFVGMVLDG